MSSRQALLVLAALLLIPGLAMAQSHFKWEENKLLVDSSGYPSNPSIAWSGSNYGIVYDNFYRSDLTSCAAYLILVNPEGNVVKGPIKIGSKAMVFYPKIAWCGDSFGVFYVAGKKISTIFELEYYFARYNSAGVKLGEKKLPGRNAWTNDCEKAKLIWTGSEYALFYHADPTSKDEYLYPRPIFLTLTKLGVAGPVLGDYQKPYEFFDLTWNGKEFALVAASQVLGHTTEAAATVLIIDKKGTIKMTRSVLGYAQIEEHCGVSIVHATGKNYVIALGNLKPKKKYLGPPAMKTSEIYTAAVAVKNKSIGNFTPRLVATNTEESAFVPKFFKVGSDLYLLKIKERGPEFVLAKINAKGEILSESLLYSDLYQHCSQVRLAWNGSGMGMLWKAKGLRFNVIQP